MRVAVVGFGHLGTYHAQKIEKHPKAELVGVVDPSEERQAAAEQAGFTVLKNWKDTPLDALVVAAPTVEHAVLCKEALLAGLHVLVEKPITSTVAEAEELVDIARQSELVLQVGHVERFNPGFQAVKEKLTSVKYITGERLSPFSGRSTDIDVIADLMIHDLDIVTALVDAPVSEVRAVGMPIITNEVDMASARIEFQNGTVAELSAGRASLEPSRKIRFITPERYVSLDYGSKEIKVVKRDITSEQTSISMEPAQAKNYDQLEAQFEAFYQSVVHGERVIVDGYAGLRALELAEEIQDAISEHRKRLRLPTSPDTPPSSGSSR